ncbi:HAD family hydrolase [Yoonia sp. 2307UL14-13]|uniref:HAD family hydrolase n=1 Tax=Yoonia sp. 2307UL14-13 TaxID=3126506 RepID=UPI0030A2A859
MKNVVFDIGGVLVDWQPHLGYLDVFATEAEALAFLDRTDFKGKNLRGDQGERFADLAQELDDPADRELFASYVSRFARMVVGEVPGTWDVLEDLRAKGVPLHAITNWSAETWPEGHKAHPRLATVFGVTVVSGHEKVLKPDPRIFALLCERAGVAAADCIFIDDSPTNVDGAKAFGMDAIHFTGADALRVALVDRGVL